ncbi:MAG: MFS transporter [Dehalococcoidia bacterium]|nr:MFS transporter [Dehalococcoidia bacterium]
MTIDIFSFLRPKPTISDEEIKTGLRWLTLEGTVSMGFSSITTSGILAAFALALGANNLQIGILAAIPFITQPLQIPAIFLVEKFQQRKSIATISWFFSQLLWFPAALIPFFIKAPSAGAISMLLVLMAVRSVLSAVCNCAWNPWIRDLIPQKILGSFAARRLAMATAVAIVFGLGAAFFVDFWKGQVSSENVIHGYTYALLFGAVFLGMASPVFMSFMPEPLMQSIPGPKPSLVQILTTPLRDINFRRLMQFQFLWGFASNLVIPFFAVNMLQRLGLPLYWVIGLSVISQLFNILFLRVWGPFADRFGSKIVLSLGVSLYLIVFLGWIFTTMPERYFLTIPLLIILHIFAGIATAAVSFTMGTIGLKLAPREQATSYLATSALAANIGAGLGPLVGGLLADFFATRQLNLVFTWLDTARSVELPVFSMTGFDFLFGIAFIAGLATLGILATVREEGEVDREVVLESLMAPIISLSQTVSSVPALSFVGNVSIGNLRRVSVPGLDVVLGVTAYQIASTAKGITTAMVRGRRIGRGLARALAEGLSTVWKDGEGVKTHGLEISQHTARGAMHALDERPLEIESLVQSVTSGVIEASRKAGVMPEDAIVGVSQGIIQGAMETDADIRIAVQQIIKTAREMAAKAGLSEETAVTRATEGALQAAEDYGSDVYNRVKDALRQDKTD